MPINSSSSGILDYLIMFNYSKIELAEEPAYLARELAYYIKGFQSLNNTNVTISALKMVTP